MPDVLMNDCSGEAAAVVTVSAPVRTEAERIAEVKAEFNRRIREGFATGGLHVHIDDGSRANLSGMALTGTAVLLGLPGISWPADYARGWVTIEGDRLPLPAPGDGIALAFAAGAYYAALVQHQADLEGDPDAEPTEGWP